MIQFCKGLLIGIKEPSTFAKIKVNPADIIIHSSAPVTSEKNNEIISHFVTSLSSGYQETKHYLE
ncbi:hypothetical protein QL818_09580 [Bacillus altitudinis]|nr:hypothetical protein [Bacillus altitudinis]